MSSTNPASHSIDTPPQDRFGLVGVTFVDKFRVERVVAEGGFGVVYAAHHLALDVPVALKVLKVPEHLNAKAHQAFLASFVQEARMMARIKHSHIVQVLDTGVSRIANDEAVPWMALEWLVGKTLAQDVRERGRRGRAPAEVFALMKPILEAVAYAHEEGVAHRDLKPGNIMLVQSRRGPVPKLLDFGIAKVMSEGELAGTGSTQTQGSFQAFSPHYAASEQIGRARTGPWTDVHALALILTELLIGGAPYTARDLSEIFREVLAEPRPTPAKFGIDVGAWEPVLTRAMAFRPDARYPNAGELLAALEQALPHAAGNGQAQAGIGFGSQPPPGSNAFTPPGVPGAAVTPSQPHALPRTTVSAAVTDLPGSPPPARSTWGVIAGAALVTMVLAGGAMAYRSSRGQRAEATVRASVTAVPPAVLPAQQLPPSTAIALPSIATVDAGAAETTDASVAPSTAPAARTATPPARPAHPGRANPRAPGNHAGRGGDELMW